MTGGVITITYNDKSTDTMSMTNDRIITTGFNNNQIGNCEITVEYEGKTAKFNVEIVKKQIRGIEITTTPTKKKYIQNYENLDLTGGVITITYNDQITDTISMMNEKVKITGFDNSKLGTYEITVEFEGMKTTFNIEIIKKHISKIEIEKTPTKKYYIQNSENLDLIDGVITIIYNDGTKDSVSMINEKINITGFDNSKIGKNTVYITYEGFETGFDIEIIEKNESTNENENKNLEQIKSKEENDKTMAVTKLPNTGIKRIVIIAAILLIWSGLICYLKYKKYNY